MKKPAVVFILLMLLQACSDPLQVVHKYTYFAFGTLIELSITGVDQALADRASAQLEQEFNQMHHDWHAWQPGPLYEVNQHLARGEPAPLGETLRPLLIKAKAYAALSQGTFHPGLGHLLKLWGFQSDDLPTRPPSQTDVDNFMAHKPDLNGIQIGTDQVRTDNPLLQFDLGGFAKGYGIDRAIEHLQGLGIKNAIVNAGGDLKVIGQRHDRRWRIGIRHPRRPGVMASLEVHDGESVFTSGDYERFFIYEGKRYHHILDPRTGYPTTDAMSVTILHDEAALADAAATAILVAGPEAWKKVAEALGIKKVMLVDSEGNIHMTPAMKDRIQLAVDHIENDEDR